MRRYTDQSYLLRLWRDHADASLRATIVTIGTPQQHHHFANLDELQYFLITRTNVTLLNDLEEVQPASTEAITYCTSDSRDTTPTAHTITAHTIPQRALVTSKENE